MADTHNNRTRARDVFWRFYDVYHRGHAEYMHHARRLEDYYLGGGRQWRADDRAAVEAQGRPAREVNTILPTVNAAAGYQIQNRMDIGFLPKNAGASEEVAKVLSKVVKHSLDNTSYRYHETDAFLDGLIQQRGWLDIRMDYGDSTTGDIKVESLDPLDVLPDPDAKSYNPDGWTDVRITRWMTVREIEETYGRDAAKEVELNAHAYLGHDFGDELMDRGGFGMPTSYANGWGWYEDLAHTRRYRIVDQQTHEYVNTLVAAYPGGEFRVVEGLSREKLGWLIEQGIPVIKRRMRRVRWCVAAPEVLLIEQMSPYDHFTVVPYFPYFRRGRTVGMVDNMVSPTDMLNKFVSQYEHVVNTSANSGWQGEENSLANMDDDEFTERAAENGLVLLRRAGTAPLEKIQPNQVPTGIDRMITFAHEFLDTVSGVDKNMRAPEAQNLSGVAIKAMQYASQQKLAIALDNLSRTREMVAQRVLGLVQRFMGQEKIILITETNEFGAEQQVPLPLNVRQEDGSIFNDLTVGEYKIAVAERPAAVTFDNTEFEQMKAMRGDMGIPIPDARVVRASTLADKSEIAQELQQAQQPDQPDPLTEAEVALKQAQARKLDAEATNKAVEAQFSGVKTAREIVLTPQAAALADALLRSAGYVDRDAAPIVPEAPPGLAAEMPAEPENSHPLFPANPDVGLDTGLTSTT